MLKKDEIESEEYRQVLLKRHKAFFDLNNRLFQLTQDMSDAIEAKKIKSGVNLHDAIAFLFGKAHKTFWAIDILAQRGFGQDAAILTRSLFEILVTIRYLANGDESWVNKYLYFDKIQDKELIDKYKRDVNSGKIPPIPEMQAVLDDKEKMKRIEKEYEKAKPLYKKNYRKDTWSGLSIRKMAEEADLYCSYYLYTLLSDRVHSNVTVVGDYKEFVEEGVERAWVIGPSESLLPAALRLSPSWFIWILEVVNKEFQLGFEGTIEDTISEIEKTIQQKI